MYSISVIGVNYKKTSVDIRSKFALTSNTIKQIYSVAKAKGIVGFFVLSTCNRTEIYATGKVDRKFIEIFKEYTSANDLEIKKYLFIKRGHNAIAHLFRVSCGLDSQIIGDYEIIGQLKNAFALSKQFKVTNGYLERVVNTALQSSKAVRNTTTFSDGTTSVAYAVIQILKEAKVKSISKNICLLGLGKIGLNTLKNLNSYLPNRHITVINRNEEKARLVAHDYNINFESFENQEKVLSTSDILIVATGADSPIIFKKSLEQTDVSLVFDLSVPSNVDQAVKNIPNLMFYNVDSLSQRVNNTLQKRQKDIPVALEIIDQHITELEEWKKRRIEYTMCVKCAITNQCELLDDENWDTVESACLMAGQTA